MLGTLLLIIHIIAAVLICIVILMQSSKGEGLSGAFGLGQGTTSFFGAETANVLVKITVGLAILFMFTSLSLAYIQARKARPVTVAPVPADEAGMVAPPSGEVDETTPPAGEAGEAETPATTEPEAAGDEPGTSTEPAVEPVQPGSSEPVEPDAGEPAEPADIDS